MQFPHILSTLSGACTLTNQCNRYIHKPAGVETCDRKKQPSFLVIGWALINEDWLFQPTCFYPELIRWRGEIGGSESVAPEAEGTGSAICNRRKYNPSVCAIYWTDSFIIIFENCQVKLYWRCPHNQTFDPNSGEIETVYQIGVFRLFNYKIYF